MFRYFFLFVTAFTVHCSYSQQNDSINRCAYIPVYNDSIVNAYCHFATIRFDIGTRKRDFKRVRKTIQLWGTWNYFTEEWLSQILAETCKDEKVSITKVTVFLDEYYEMHLQFSLEPGK